jgi:hypothetical protein|tara:strand:+ start:190 stop:684 length:495 start_codon:yes stop_codon:yes gene_type:complete
MLSPWQRNPILIGHGAVGDKVLTFLCKIIVIRLQCVCEAVSIVTIMQSPGNPPEQVNPDGSQWSDDASESLDPAKSPIWVNPRKSMGQISPQWAISLLQQSNPLIAAYPHARERLKKRHSILALCQQSPFTQNRKNQQTTINLRVENNKNDKAEKDGVADHDDQ